MNRLPMTEHLGNAEPASYPTGPVRTAPVGTSPNHDGSRFRPGLVRYREDHRSPAESAASC